MVVVDYGVGNLHSVVKALQKVGAQPIVSSDKNLIAKADKLVLPGVGNFGQCAKNLDDYGLRQTVLDFAKSGKPFLGICVGMQLLFSSSEESEEFKGLGLIEGKVVKLSNNGLKVPQIGWNKLSFPIKSQLFDNIKSGDYVYFVHSYYANAACNNTIATTDYGDVITAAVQKDNIFGVQFHPEKSGLVGLKILGNFKEM